MGCQGLFSSLQDLEGSPDGSYVLAQFQPLLGDIGTCSVEIRRVEGSKEGSVTDGLPRMISLPEQWESPCPYDTIVYWPDAWGRAVGVKERVASVLLTRLEPGRYVLSRFSQQVTAGSTITTTSVELDREFVIERGKVVYIGSFGFEPELPHSFPFSFPSSPGSEKLQSTTEVFQIDNSPALLAILDLEEAGLGKAVAKRLAKAEPLEEPSFQRQQLQRLMWYALPRGDTSLLQAVLDAGADVDAPYGGSSPLHTASLLGETEAAQVLLSAGADVNAADILGQTPLDLASRANNEQMSALLRAHGAKAGSSERGAYLLPP